jgi:hypothetical protein
VIHIIFGNNCCIIILKRSFIAPQGLADQATAMQMSLLWQAFAIRNVATWAAGSGRQRGVEALSNCY